MTATRNSYPNKGEERKWVSTQNEGAIVGIVSRTVVTGERSSHVLRVEVGSAGLDSTVTDAPTVSFLDLAMLKYF